MLKKQINVSFKKDKEKVRVYVTPPSYKVDQELKTAYAVAYRKAISLGVATRSSMLELLRKEQIWGDEEEERLLTKTVEAATVEAELRNAIGSSDRKSQKEVALKLVGLRNELYGLVQIKSLPLAHTAESIAEDVRLDKFVSLCTFHEDGRQYFKTHDDFLNRRSETDVIAIFNAVIDELSKHNAELLIKLPENQWFINNGLMDKEGNVREKELVDLLTEINKPTEVAVEAPKEEVKKDS